MQPLVRRSFDRPLLWSAIAVTFVTVYLGASPAVAQGVDYDGDCGVARWWCGCDTQGAGNCNAGTVSPPVTNWSTDGHPSMIDSVFIDASFGPIELFSDTTVQSLSAEGGLLIDNRSLTLHMASAITDLELTSTGLLEADFTGFGQFVALEGTAQIHGELSGPGSFESFGDVDLSFAKLRNGATFKSHGAATVSSGQVDLGNSHFENLGGMTVTGGLDVRGSEAVFESTANLHLSDGTVFSPKYEQRDGILEVASGTVTMASTSLSIETSPGSASASIARDAALVIATELASALEGGLEHARFTGEGALILREDLGLRFADVTLGFGAQPGPGPDRGGGFNLRAALFGTGDGVLVNRGRLRFQAGSIRPGALGAITFVNKGTAYTYDVGRAVLEVWSVNEARFYLIGPDLVLGEGASFRNDGRFEVQRGNVTRGTGSVGSFHNEGVATLDGKSLPDLTSDPSVVSVVEVPFDNVEKVEVLVGTLRFEDLENLTAGVLNGGRWFVDTQGILEVPEPITQIVGAEVALLGGSFPALDALTAIKEASKARVGPGAQLEPTEPQLDLGEDGVESVVPELEGIVVLARAPGGLLKRRGGATPEIVVPLLRNRSGRVRPSQAGQYGTLRLDGSYQQDALGRLAIDLQTAGADRFEIDGAATISGKLELVRTGPAPVGASYTVLTASGGLSGTFDEVLGFDEYTVTYDPTSVVVTLDAANNLIFADGFESGDTGLWN